MSSHAWSRVERRQDETARPTPGWSRCQWDSSALSSGRGQTGRGTLARNCTLPRRPPSWALTQSVRPRVARSSAVPLLLQQDLQEESHACSGPPATRYPMACLPHLRVGMSAPDFLRSSAHRPLRHGHECGPCRVDAKSTPAVRASRSVAALPTPRRPVPVVLQPHGHPPAPE